MKPSVLFLIAVALVAAGIACAGCTSQPPQGSGIQTTVQATGTAAPATQATGTAAGAPAVAPGATISSGSVFGTNYNWFEYVNTMSGTGKTLTTTVRTEKSTGTYKGATAIHYKNTMTSEMGSSVTDIYYDNAMNVLGGTVTTVVEGKSYTMEIPASQLKSQGGPTFEKQTTLTYIGPDQVTVPAGSYTAGKYSASTDAGAVTYWVAPGVPLPVKYSMGMQGSDISAELKGWG